MKRAVIEFKNAEGVKFKLYYRKIRKADLKGCQAKDADGICENPEGGKPKIIVDSRLKNKRKLQVLIEEIFHAFVFEEKEKVARRFAMTLAEMIILLGWQPDGKKKNKK